MRWYVRYSLSYRDVEELLAERGIEVDHTTLFRWVARFTPLFTEAARPLRHTPGDRWCVDENVGEGRRHVALRPVDFRSLSAREFGTIYEGLPGQMRLWVRSTFGGWLFGDDRPEDVELGGSAAG